MQIELWINEKKVKGEIEPDEILLDFLRKQGMTSVKRGCETSNCGLCTVFLDEKPVLSCSILAARADTGLRLLRDFRKKRRNSARPLPTRGRSSAVSAIRAL